MISQEANEQSNWRPFLEPNEISYRYVYKGKFGFLLVAFEIHTFYHLLKFGLCFLIRNNMKDPTSNPPDAPSSIPTKYPTFLPPVVSLILEFAIHPFLYLLKLVVYAAR